MTRPVLGLFVALALPAAAGAASFTVNSTADAVDAAPGNGTCATAGGACTLRAAVQEANALAGADSITLPPGTFALTLAGSFEDAAATGDLDVTDALEVVGAGRDETIIDGIGADSIFHVTAAVPFTLRAATLRNGFGTAGAGGAILHVGGGALTIDAARFRGNSAGTGGAVAHTSGALTITDTIFSENFAAGVAGAVFHATDATTISGCEFSDNASLGVAGGLYALGAGNTTVTNTTFTRHQSATGGCVYAGITGSVSVSGSRFTECSGGAGVGGGLYVATNTGNLAIQNTTFERSSAAQGSGVYATVDGNVSVSGSAFTDGAGTTGPAGMFSTAAGTFTLVETRFERNEAPTAYGGALSHSGSGGVTLTDVTFDDNLGLIGAGAYVVTSAGVVVTRAAFRDNLGIVGQGGGLHVAATGAISIAESAFSGNVSGQTPGAGAYLSSGSTVDVQRSTFANNAAYGPGALSGGLLAGATAVTIGNSTFSGNVSGAQGGAYYAAVPTTIASSTFVGTAA
jgi:CSLREA domain-containing protein